MTAEPRIQGWCPGALRPMRSGDGWVVRVRPRLGTLSGAQARGVAELALRYGSGWLDVSSRANLQIRGVDEPAMTPLLAGLGALDLLDADADAETRRNVLVTPFRDEDDAASTMVARLEQALARRDAPDLPAKFGFAVDCGPAPVLAGDPADIRIERGEANTLLCRADGADEGVAVTPETAAEVALGLARWFLESGGAPGGRGRMARHLARGAVLPPDFSGVRRQAPASRPVPGPTTSGHLVGIALGQLRAETLAALGEGPLRLTPWRMILLAGRGAPDGLDGMIATPDDPLLDVIACTGAPGCFQAHQPTRALARALAGRVAGLLHVSGCAKGCAHPASAALTLVGTPAGFDLVRRGTPSDPPERRGLPPDPAAILDRLT